MAAQSGQLAACCHGPELNGRIRARRCQARAIGAEGHAQDVALMALERPNFFPGGHIPEFDSLISAGRGQMLAVGTEGEVRPLASAGTLSEVKLDGRKVA